MTSGGFSVTSGGDVWRWFDHPRFGPWLTVAAIGLALALVNAASVLTESAGRLPLWAPFVWEFSSFVVILAMAPCIGAAVRRWPARRDQVARFVLIHGALTLPFGLAHVAGVFIIRSSVYWAAGETYVFFGEGVLTRVLYEWRKDVLVYAGIALIYALFQSRRTDPRASDDRIEIREGATAVFLAPRDILWVEAAGNYVEIHTSTRGHLVRGTLAAWERKLAGRDFARAHRSRLVNRLRVTAIKPTAAGDAEITFDDGRSVAGSRRYRDTLRPAR